RAGGGRGGEVPQGEAAAVGAVRGRDPGRGPENPNLSRHLRLRRGCDARLRRRRQVHPGPPRGPTSPPPHPPQWRSRRRWPPRRTAATAAPPRRSSARTAHLAPAVMRPPRCSPLPFDLNVADPEAADEMDWLCDTLLHL
ncbi:hypothetical protein BAE44_0025540, partial [Dichanthelium oligosanthes]